METAPLTDEELVKCFQATGKMRYVDDLLRRYVGRIHGMIDAVTKFVWDLSAVPTGQAGGWLLIAELDGLDSDALTRTYTWGLDLSGTFRGAGGIRLRSGSYGGHVVGLLMVDDEAGDGFCGYFAYDGNGNVGQVLDAEDLSTDAHYEYDPYGREIVATGTYADENPWRFSTKYLDVLDPNDTDASLLHYGYRYLSPRLGRWMSRDPIGILGGINLYRFVSNNAILKVDADGRIIIIVPDPPEALSDRWTCDSAYIECRRRADVFRENGWLLAAELLEHFLDPDGPFDTTDHIEEIRTHARRKICEMVRDEVCSLTGALRPVSIAPANPEDSNIRWRYRIGNMVHAYGGARLTVSGTATMSGRAWSGLFDVTMRDTYEWSKAGKDTWKGYIGASLDTTYSAALYLQVHCGYDEFDHIAKFELPCSGCCNR